MGMIHIEVMGSFKPNESKSFSAQNHGHAQAVADAIEWLSNVVLPRAIRNDHECHAEGIHPNKKFGKEIT